MRTTTALSYARTILDVEALAPDSNAPELRTVVYAEHPSHPPMLVIDTTSDLHPASLIRAAHYLRAAGFTGTRTLSWSGETFISDDSDTL